MSVKGLARREAILEAALGMLLEPVGRTLTLEGVARRAGVSKGGLTHHFPTKETLIEAVFARILRVFDTQVTELSGGKAIGTREEMEAYITASLQQPMRGMAAELGVGVVSMLGDDPVKNDRLLDPMRRLYARYLGAFRSGGARARFPRAAVLFLAVEAVLFLDIFRLCAFSQEEMGLVKAELLRLAAGLEAGA